MDWCLCNGSSVIFERARGAEIAELALDKVQNFLVRDVARGGDHEMIGREPVTEAVNQMITIEGANGFGRAKNGAAQRMLWPEASRENVVKLVFGIVQVHLDFFENDLALFFYIFGIKLWAEDEIGDDVKSDGQMLVKNFGVEAN